MFQASKLFISYKHIQSKTPENLEKQMLKIQVESRKPVEFTAPNFSNGRWHTWYLNDFSKDIRPKDKLELNNTGGN